jgi:hypothetical protein
MSAEFARESSFRRKKFRDRFQKTNQFVVVALTNGYAMTETEANALIQQEAGDPSSDDSPPPPKRWARQAFRGRILDGKAPNPHAFLEDPCDLAETTSARYTAALIIQHTEFILTQDYNFGRGSTMVERNDRINVYLEPGAGDTPFNLERGWATGINRKRKYNKKRGKKAVDCTSIKDIWDNAEHMTGTTLSTFARNAPGSSRSGHTDIDAAYEAFWNAIEKYMPGGMRYHGGRTVDEGRDLIRREADSRRLSDKCPYDDMSYAQTECLVPLLNADGFDVAIPEESNHCIGEGCAAASSGVLAFDLGTDAQSIEGIEAISEGLTKFYNDTGPTGYEALVEDGKIQEFHAAGFTASRADDYNHPGGWHVERGNKGVHVEIKFPQGKGNK